MVRGASIRHRRIYKIYAGNFRGTDHLHRILEEAQAIVNDALTVGASSENDFGGCCWGITASDGPGPHTIKVGGIERQFFGYLGRGVPYGPDDGTLAPWAVVASLPFAPEIVLPTLDYCIHQVKLTRSDPYGFKATFNPSYPVKSNNPYGWVSPWHYGLNQGPIVLMIENYHTSLLLRLMRDCPYITCGLQRAGFGGGWL